MTINFSKQYNSPEDIVALLSNRELVINDKEEACQYIRNIGYYRLSAYLYPFLAFPKERQLFKAGSEFEAAIKLYRFDKKLRIFLFNEIEKIEISLRSTLANIIAKETNNIFWMTDNSMFANPNKFNRTMDLIDKEFNNSKEDFIQHFKQKYSNAHPPAWMLVEILPLGVITRIYENIKSYALKKKIAAYYGLPVPVFTSWLTVITLTRNSCCHHSRVWNRQYAVNPMLAKKIKRPWISDTVSPYRTFYEICIIKWFVNIVSPYNDMKQHLQMLFEQYPNVDVRAMGVPVNWADEPLWKEM
jgi:abortive infection bacteriophage resistance protein